MNLCDICDAQLLTIYDWLYQCPKCHFLRSTLPANAGTDVDGIETLRQRNSEIILDRLSQHMQLKSSRALEVGCSEGWFMDAAQRRCMNIIGVEPEVEKAKIAKNKGHQVIEGFFPDIMANSNEKFDLIIFNDVFEHLPQPKQVLPAIDRLLNDQGILVINIPDSNGILYHIARMMSKLGYHKFYDRLWQKGFSSPHISYFNATNLNRFVCDNTSLKRIYYSSLPALQIKGLYERIRSSHSWLNASIIYSALLLILPIIMLGPADVSLQFYKKS